VGGNTHKLDEEIMTGLRNGIGEDGGASMQAILGSRCFNLVQKLLQPLFVQSGWARGKRKKRVEVEF
jgi:hypothetical protein